MAWVSIFYVWFRILWAFIVYPFITKIALWLQKLFPEKKTDWDLRIEKLAVSELGEASLIALKQDVVSLIKRVFTYNMNLFGIDTKLIFENDYQPEKVLNIHKNLDNILIEENYKKLKIVEEKLLQFAVGIKSSEFGHIKLNDINKIYSAIINSVYSAKYLKDIKHNIDELSQSQNVFMKSNYQNFRVVLLDLYKNISEVIDGKDSVENLSKILEIFENIKASDRAFVTWISKELIFDGLDQFELSGLINTNRYVYLSCKSIIFSIRDLLLDDEKIKILEKLT